SAPRLEQVIHAQAHGLYRQPRRETVGGLRERANERLGRGLATWRVARIGRPQPAVLGFAEISELILDLHGPMAAKHVLGADARRPADVVLIDRRSRGDSS